jgi:CxxC-x17-CxxC domain-containing protein
MEFQDKVLTCIDCGAQFIFTAGEQLFFYDKQFKNEPKRCKSCKSKRAALLNSSPFPRDGQRSSRVETRATCSQCGKETTVPFKPTQGRPILCREKNATSPPHSLQKLGRPERSKPIRFSNRFAKPQDP